MIKNQMALRHNENIEGYVQYGILERVIKMKEDKKKEENKKLDVIKLVILTILKIFLRDIFHVKISFFHANQTSHIIS